MHPLSDALPVCFVPVRVTLGVLIGHQCSYAPLLCRVSQFCRTLYLSISLERYFDCVFDGVGLEGFRSRINASYCPELISPFLSFTIFSSYPLWVVFVGLGSPD